MPRRQQKTGKLTCCACKREERFPITSPAAPQLSMCEAAAKVGWAYQIGFFTMLTGDHHPLCPDCKGARRAEAEGT